MLVKIILLLALALVAAYFWRATKGAKSQPTHNLPMPSSKPSPYRSVNITPGKNPCQAVLTYQNKDLLMHEAPTLPVPGCDAKLCGCKFLRYEDRRKDDRRAGQNTAATEILAEHDNQRQRKDRRKPKSF